MQNMTHIVKRGAVLMVVLAAGIYAAVLIAPSPALAYGIGNLPSWCSQGTSSYDAGTGLYSYSFLCGTARASFTYGTAAYPAAPTDSSFASNLDSFANANAPATTTTTTTTQASTTTPTTTAAPTTTTTAAAPATTTTGGAAPATTTTTASTQATTAPAATTTVVVTTTDCPGGCQQAITALAAQVAALQAEVTQLVSILRTWPGIDPGILSQLVALGA
ncbi:MAG: hypothetical protein KGL39_48310 [Patescibacteria group bacterium]|nr:hypothetical protein [Patescibacteria group bacterium]